MINIAARVLIPAAVSFTIGMSLAMPLAGILYKAKAWKKSAGKGKGIGGGDTSVFNSLHKEREVSTPRMGGVLIWASVLITAFIFLLFSYIFKTDFDLLNFIDRRETWLPLFALIIGAGVGLIDDLLEVTRGDGGLSLTSRLNVVFFIGLIAGWWFYTKLGVVSVGIPFSSPLVIGWLIVPLFAFITLAIYAGGTIDGLDGLAGGIFSIIFIVYAVVALDEGLASLAAFSASVAGATLAFLWFNIPPARFYMSETGSMSLTLALAMTSFTSDTLGGGVGIVILPIVALPLTATVATTLLQVFWKKSFKRKLFHSAPIHHHFEAIGWPTCKVVMRYWVITIITSILGLTVALLSTTP